MGWIRIDIETESQSKGMLELMSGNIYWVGGEVIYCESTVSYAMTAKTKHLDEPIPLLCKLNTAFLIPFLFLVISCFYLRNRTEAPPSTALYIQSLCQSNSTFLNDHHSLLSSLS